MRVLIVEDEAILAFELEQACAEHGSSDVRAVRSVAAAEAALREPVDFAFLDVDVEGGKTYSIASRLAASRVPFAFVSGSLRIDLPEELRNARFIRKPFRDRDIAEVLASA